MTKKFENKKLNKDDHAKVDKDASIVRTVVEGVVASSFIGFAVKKIPWKKVGGTISKVVFKG